tara:strand:+ start:559 stop:849 length:291 start_codon:yes stop_codon:yes gene_type:complete
MLEKSGILKNKNINHVKHELVESIKNYIFNYDAKVEKDKIKSFNYYSQTDQAGICITNKGLGTVYKSERYSYNFATLDLTPKIDNEELVNLKEILL